MKTINAKDLHAKDMTESPEYREAYNALESEFKLLDSLIKQTAASPLPVEGEDSEDDGRDL